MVAVVQEAYVNGVSTRKVDRLVEQMGVHMSKDQVSRLCRGLDEQVQAFRERPLEGRYPYLWLDGKIEKVRERGGVRQKCLVIAYAVHETGRREVIGLDVGEAETEAFWREFLRSLRARGLTGVRLCVSDCHQGLKNAIAQVLGTPWQRCTVHFLRNMLGHCAKSQQPMIAAAIRGIFAADDGKQARERLAEVVERLEPVAPKVAQLLLDAEEDLLGFYAFPREHWSKLRSTNPLERVNREIGRRTDVVGIFPNDASADPPRRHAAHRAKRRMARRPPLPLPRITLSRPGREPITHTSKIKEVTRPQRRLRDQRLTDDPELHHKSLLDCGLTRNEETLLAHGKQDLVRQYRLAFQETVAPTAKGAVEELTGRRVVGYHSQVVFDPMRAFEIFVLAPES